MLSDRWGIQAISERAIGALHRGPLTSSPNADLLSVTPPNSALGNSCLAMYAIARYCHPCCRWRRSRRPRCLALGMSLSHGRPTLLRWRAARAARRAVGGPFTAIIVAQPLPVVDGPSRYYLPGLLLPRLPAVVRHRLAAAAQSSASVPPCPLSLRLPLLTFNTLKILLRLGILHSP